MIARSLRRLANWLFWAAARFDRNATPRQLPAVSADLLWRDVTPGDTIRERPTVRVKALKDAELMESLTPVPGTYGELDWNGKGKTNV